MSFPSSFNDNVVSHPKFSSSSSLKNTPGELLKMYRTRCGFSLAQTAEWLDLKSVRMVQKWEGDYALPTADKLKKLIELFLSKKAFKAGEEQQEVAFFWQRVKEFFEASRERRLDTYPIFDQKWFSELLLTTNNVESTSSQSLQTSQIKVEAILVPVSISLTKGNLPTPLHDLVGRDHEVKAVCTLFQKKRLVTLTGMGGMGKTRLALAIAERLQTNLTDGAWWVPLAHITDPTLIAATIVQALEVKSGANQSVEESLKTYLADKEFLLVLDNFEQLLPDGAALVTKLLQIAPRVKILVTSREGLQLSLENEYEVAPLALPTKTINLNLNHVNLTDYSAVALFMERAKAAKPNFNLTTENMLAVLEICQKLDGMPLALELAAARIRILSPKKVLERLNLKMLEGGSRDLPQRQQTIRGTLDWSYDLLEAGEQRLLSRLSIFVGGCTIEAAEAVCNADGDLENDLLDGIDSLLQKNLLRQWEGTDGERRYGMLYIIRQYALDKLAESGEQDKLLEQYATYYTELTQELEAKLLVGKTQPQSLQVLDSDYVNIREILHESLDSRSIKLQIGLRLIASLKSYWRIRGYFSEGWHYVEQAINLTQTRQDKERASVLEVAGDLKLVMADFQAASNYLEEAIELYREIGDDLGRANCLKILGTVATIQGELTTATKRYEQALTLYKKAENKRGMAICLGDLGLVYLNKGELTNSTRYYKEAVTAYRQLDSEGFKSNISICLNNLAFTAIWQGDLASANSYSQEALQLAEQIGDRRALAISLDNAGFLAAWQGELVAADLYLQRALLLSQELSEKYLIAKCVYSLAHLAILQEDLVGATNYLEEALFLAQKINAKLLIILILIGLGNIALQQKEFSQAIKYYEEGLLLTQNEDYALRKIPFLVGLATVALEQDDITKACEYLVKNWSAFPVADEQKLLLELLCTIIGIKLKAYSSLKVEALHEVLISVASLAGAINGLVANSARKSVMEQPWCSYYEEGQRKPQDILAPNIYEEALQQGQKQGKAIILNLSL